MTGAEKRGPTAGRREPVCRAGKGPGLAPGYGTQDLLISLGVFAIVVGAAMPLVLATVRIYERDGAARQVLAAIRQAQSEAVMRGSVVGLHWGADPAVNRPESEYRIVRDGVAGCDFPDANAAEDGSTVLQGWRDLETTYPGLRIAGIRDAANQPLNAVMFSSFGAAVNPCTTVSFPITVSVDDPSGDVRTIEIRSAGGTSLE